MRFLASPLACAVAALAVASAAPAEEGAPAPTQAPTLRLVDCLAIARVAHENALIARAQVGQAEQGTKAAEADRFPQVNVQGTAREGGLGESVIAPGGQGSYLRQTGKLDAYVDFSWSIVDPRRERLIDRARLVERQTRATSLGTLRDLDLSVAAAFIDLERAEKLVAVQDEILGIDRDTARILLQREHFGGGNKVETAQADAEVALVAQILLTAEHSLEKARITLLSAMGLAEDPGVRFVVEAVPLDVQLPPLQTCLETAYAQRDDVSQLQSALDIARVDVKLADLGKRISYRLGATAYNNLASKDTPASWEVAFSAGFPLFDGGKARANLRAARAGEVISEAQLSAALRNVWQQVTGAYRDSEASRQKVLAARFAEQAGARSLEQTQTSFRLGLSSFFETLSARLQYAQAKQQLVEAESGLRLALWTLHRAAPGAVSGVNPLGDPAIDAPPASAPESAAGVPGDSEASRAARAMVLDRAARRLGADH